MSHSLPAVVGFVLFFLLLITGGMPGAAAEVAAAQAGPFPTQTPVAVSPARPDPFAYGVASGDMTAASAILWTRVPGEADVLVENYRPGVMRRAQKLLHKQAEVAVAG